MPRRRQAKNRGLAKGLYRKPTGAYYGVHPITHRKVYYGTADLAEASALHAQASLLWQREQLEIKAALLDQSIRVAGKQSVLFTQFCGNWRETVLPTLLKKSGKPLSMRTRDDYARMLQHQIEPARLLATPMRQLTTDTIRQFLAPWMTKPSFYNYLRAVLSRVLTDAVDRGELSTNPILAVTKRPVAKRETLITDQDFIAIRSRLSDFDAHVVDLLYLISHNPVDVLNLRESQITAGKHRGRSTIEIRLQRHKTGVVVELWDWEDSDLASTVEWFRERKRLDELVSPHLIVFPRSSRRDHIGQPMSVGYLSHRFTAAAVACGFKGVYTLRDLRPKGLTDEFQLAGDSDKGGHKTAQMKAHYRRGELPMHAKNNLNLLKSSLQGNQ